MLAIESHSVHNRSLQIERNKKQSSTVTNSVGTTKSMERRLVNFACNALPCRFYKKLTSPFDHASGYEDFIRIARLVINDNFFQQDFLIDAGVDVSALRTRNCQSNRKTMKTTKLFVANGSHIHTYV